MAKNVHGAWSGPKDPTENTQYICDQLKSRVEEFTGKTYEVFRAVKYREQGAPNQGSYLIKVYAGVEDYIHLSVSQLLMLNRDVPFPIDTLRGVEQGRLKDSPLLHFVSLMK